jgi:hypothetical protein
MLHPVKKYRRYNDQSTGEKVYRPTYRGIELIWSQFPFLLWQYKRADDAQAHAERHEVRKRLQVKRFQDEDYRTAVLTRYAALMLIAAKQEEENE